MLLLVIAFVLSASARAFADDPLLKPHDRLAILGGTFVERMQAIGALEAELHCRRPEWRLRVRNLGWSGDDVHGIARKVFDGPKDGFQRLLRDVATADPTVVLVAYGFAEASDGDDAVQRFRPGLQRLVGELTKQQHLRVILMTPFSMPGVRVDGYTQSIDRCCSVVQSVAEETGSGLIVADWRPREEELETDQLLPNAAGYASFAAQIAGDLVGGEPCEGGSDELRRRIVDKNQLFFHRYRPQNETYLFLFRKHEQGNNAVEIPMYDPLVDAADHAIWATKR